MTTNHGKILIGLAAALLGLAACDGGGEAPTTTDQPAATTAEATADGSNAVDVATGFVVAFGASDADRAISYLAEDADLSTTDAQNVEGLPSLLALLQAFGYEQIPGSCEEDGSSSAGTHVTCPFAFHAIRSDEIGFGPYGGSYFDLTVLGGEITDASWSWEIERFSPEMWEPFRDWVRSAYPEDFDVMYVGDGGNFALTEESIRLWEQHTHDYVEEVAG